MKRENKIFNWRFFLGLFLVSVSAALYYLHYVIFHDAHHIFIYLLGDIAFIPAEVLLVTLIIHHMLEKHEKKARMKKLNMLVGVFFSDTGTPLLRVFTEFDKHAPGLRDRLNIAGQWPENEFADVMAFLRKRSYEIETSAVKLENLRGFMCSKMDLLLNLLANPNVLEQERFTELLWAVLHLAEELSNRKSFKDLPGTDHEHLSGDIKRAYVLLIERWVEYMRHLKADYPYLFSLAVRTNPFIPDQQVIVGPARV
ncbi:MAG: hypothetical protein ABH883_02920 [Candidatus Omnitrophota bacterium]